MGISFAGGTAVPAVGTAAYKQAQGGFGTGTYNPQSGTISQGVIAPSSTAGVAPIGANGGAVTGDKMAPKTTVPVITSQTAQQDYNKKYQAYTDSLKNIQAQTDRIAQDKAIQDSLKVQDELHKSATNLEQQGLDIKKAEVEAKNQALKMASGTEETTPVQTTAPTTTPPSTGTTAPQTGTLQTTSTPSAETTAYNQSMGAVQDARTQAIDQYKTQVAQMMNGTFPLSTEETALVNSVQQSLERQKASVTGVENMAAARGGQEYTPQQMVGNLANKIMNLDAMAAGTMANLKMGFMKQDYQMINDSYEKQQKYLDDKTQTIQKLHDAVLAQEKEQRATELATKKELDTNRNSLLLQVTKNGATREVQDAIKNATDIPSMIQAAGNYLHSESDILDAQYKKAQISKIYSDIKNDAEKLIQEGSTKGLATFKDNPAELIAYASQYAATGKIPTGLPKGTFGAVAQYAKELPKQKGQILDIATGISPDADSTAVTAYSSLNSAIDLAKQLKELDAERWGGIVAGTAGKVFGSEAQQKYVDLRSQIVDLLSRARSGAALTPSEEARYGDMLPGRFSESFNLGAESDLRIDNFIGALTSDLKNKTSSRGWAINGLSDVTIDGNKYTVGDVIDNGTQKGRINADGSITLIQ